MNNRDDKTLGSGVPRLEDYPHAIPVPYSDPFEQPEAERHLRDYVHILFRRKWTFFTFFVVVVTTVLLRTFLTTPIYRATVTLKIDDDRPAVMLFDRSNSYYTPSSEDYLQTMYKILQSRNLARRVINALTEDKQLASSSAIPSGLTRRDGEIDSGIVANFLSKVTVSPVPNTRLIMVGFDSTDPAVAATTANVIARACTELNMETKSNATDWVRNLLDNQLQDMKAKVERSEEALNKYVAQNNLVFATEDRSASPVGFGPTSMNVSAPSDRLENLTSQLTQATAERISKELLLKEAQQGNDEVLLSAIASNTFVDSIRKEHMSKQAEYARLSLVYKPDHPKMMKLKDEIKQLKSQISAEVRVAVAQLKKDHEVALKKENLFKAAVDDRKKMALNMSDKMVQYQILKRDADTNKELYNGILQRLKETGLNANLARSNIQVLDKADVPAVPYKPDRKRNMLLALFIGLFGGLGLAFFTDYLDNTVKTPDDVEKTILLPALGLVPNYPKTQTAACGPSSARSIRSRHPCSNLIELSAPISSLRLRSGHQR